MQPVTNNNLAFGQVGRPTVDPFGTTQIDWNNSKSFKASSSRSPKCDHCHKPDWTKLQWREYPDNPPQLTNFLLRELYWNHRLANQTCKRTYCDDFTVCGYTCVRHKDEIEKIRLQKKPKVEPSKSKICNEIRNSMHAPDVIETQYAEFKENIGLDQGIGTSIRASTLAVASFQKHAPPPASLTAQLNGSRNYVLRQEEQLKKFMEKMNPPKAEIAKPEGKTPKRMLEELLLPESPPPALVLPPTALVSPPPAPPQTKPEPKDLVSTLIYLKKELQELIDQKAALKLVITDKSEEIKQLENEVEQREQAMPQIKEFAAQLGWDLVKLKDFLSQSELIDLTKP